MYFLQIFLFISILETNKVGTPGKRNIDQENISNMDDSRESNDIEESGGLLWNCCVCNASFATKRLLLHHIRTTHRLKGEDAEIVAKRKFTPDVGDLHSTKKKKIDEEKDTVGNVGKDDQMHWKCLDCGNIYVHKSSAKIHLKKDHNVNLAESLGHLLEVTKEELGHVVIREEHGGLYKCKKCWKEYVLKSSVVRHLKADHHVAMKNVHNFIENPSPQEGKLNNEAPALDKRPMIKRKPTEKIWKCKICQVSFQDQKSIEDHMSSVHAMRISKSRAYMEVPLSDDEDDNQDYTDESNDSEPPNITQNDDEEYRGETGSGLTKLRQWGCRKCGTEFCHKKDALRHLRVRHKLSEKDRYEFLKKLDDKNMPELEKEKSVLPKSSENWQSSVSGENYSSKSEMNKHMETCHKTAFNEGEHVKSVKLSCAQGYSQDEVITIESNDEEETCIADNNVTASAKEGATWGCQRCKKTFIKKSKVTDHMRMYHNLSLIEAGETGKDILIRRLNGKEIQWRTDVEEEVFVDVETAENKPQKEWFCKLCNKSYFRRSDGARHCRISHNVSYDEGKLLVLHISELPESRSSKAEEKVSNQREGNEENEKQQPWKCMKCSQQFHSKPDIQRHLTDIHFIADQDHEFFIERNKDFIRKWMCSKCGQRFYHRFDTSRHINLTHDVVWEKAKDFVQFIDDCDSSLLEAQDKDESKPYVCLICRKLFCAKKQLMIHLQNFHRAKINADNIAKHVLSFRKVHSRNWDCISPEAADNKNHVPLSLLSSYMVEEDTEARIEDSFNLDDVEVKILKGDGSYTEETWAKIIGTSYESASNKSTSYRPKKDIENKRFICMLCNLRYYKMKEAQRHMFLKHKISYIEAVNYINENKDVVFNQDAEGPSERTPKRRKIREEGGHLFYCTLCMKAAIHFQSSQQHITNYHKEKKENVCKKICRSQNVDVFKLGNEDKMNFVCVLCCVTFRSRIDGFKHIAKEHTQVPQDEISEFLFTKDDKMKTCVVKFNKSSGVVRVFSVMTEDILNDVKFSEISTVREEEGSEDEEEKKKAVKMEKDDGKDVFMDYENVEDSLAILLMNMSNPESFQKFSYNEFYYIFSIPAKSQKNIPFSIVSHISCPNCPRQFIDQRALHKHLLSCCVPKQNTWECMNCRKSFKSVGSLVNHIQKQYNLQGTDVLNFMHSREIVIAPENGVEIVVDGRSDEDIKSLFHTKKSEENVENDDEESIQSTDEGDTRKQCFVCGYKCSDRKALFKHCEEAHSITGHNNRFTECIKCMTYFKSRMDIMDHLHSVHGIKCPKLYEKSHVCVLCEEKFSDNVQLAKHVRTHGNKFTCKHCTKRFESYSKMATHLKIHLEKFPRKPMNCIICNLSVPGESYLGHLIVHYDRKYGPWKCLVCEKDFHLRRNLKEHLKGEHQISICEKCGKTFNCMYTLKQHEAVHRNKVKCTLCSKQFDNKIELAIHKRIHIKYWICHICGRNLPNQNALSGHLKAHKEKKALTSTQKSEKYCQICSRNFSSYEMYQKHQAIHKGDRLHCCQYCGKKYSYLGSLKLHFRTNHPEHKPYKCVVCGKTFSTFHQRFLHMREHKDYRDPIRPFKCSFCPGRFKHKMSLQRHERLKHFNESLIGFRCEKCNKEFTSGQNLLRHAMFCEPILTEHPGGVGGSVMVENESTGLEVVAEETVALETSGGRSEDPGGPQSVQVHTINIGSEVLSFSCSDQEELILEVPEGMLVETDNGYQIIVSEGS